MRFALCLHGYFGNRADPDAGIDGLKHIKEKLLDIEKFDVFIHSWDVDNSERITDAYEPYHADGIIEPQSKFERDFDKYNLHEAEAYINEGHDRSSTLFSNCTIFNTLSFLTSRKKSIQMALDKSSREMFEYGCIVSARFDLGQRDKNYHGKYKVSPISFIPHAPMNRLYSAMWDQLNVGYADQWFYGSQRIMKTLSNASEAFVRDIQPGSLYEQLATTAWPDSLACDPNSTTAPEQFSNEMLKPRKERSADLMKFDKFHLINNHLYYKWFAMRAGLYGISEFLCKEE